MSTCLQAINSGGFHQFILASCKCIKEIVLYIWSTKRRFRYFSQLKVALQMVSVNSMWLSVNKSRKQYCTYYHPGGSDQITLDRAIFGFRQFLVALGGTSGGFYYLSVAFCECIKEIVLYILSSMRLKLDKALLLSRKLKVDKGR